ncbi:MAG: alpha-amylase [Clostridia bacterium]|nr:alpha-amylase [Clostridia bacterium]
MTLKNKLRSSLIIALAMLTLLVSCGSKEPAQEARKPSVPDETIVEFDDKYRNFYEIFVRSFKDSNGDGYGDLNGITEKLDYLKPPSGAAANYSLGINGIWLMPICPSPSYHKYDVTDYCAIDPMYGTMEDFENLVQKCHDRKITLIIDMVVNHTSDKHEWFVKFCDVVKCRQNGETSQYDEKYGEYYTCYTEEELLEMGAIKITQPDSDYFHYSANGARFRPIPDTNSFYECSFSDDMPELNFDSELVWQELEKVFDFWLDKGVDGFRFDAVMWFYAYNTEKNTQVLKRINDYCLKKNPDFYGVGEAWTGSAIVKEYYNSGMNSFFNFNFANTSGYLATTIKSHNGAEFAQKVQKWNNTLKLISSKGSIDAPFISNHDMYRSSSYFSTLSQRKMCASLYLMLPGNPFIYYGEEIGLNGTAKDSSKKDATARMAMKWSEKEDGSSMIGLPWVDFSVNQDNVPGVEEQKADENSLFNHYRLVLKLKNQNPQIARGTVTACDFGDSEICAYTSIYDGTAVMVIHNLSIDEKEFDIAQLGYSDFTEFRGYVVSKAAEGEKETNGAPVLGASSEEETEAEKKDAVASLENGKLIIPGRTTVILRSTEHYNDVVINPDSIAASPEDEQVQAMNED